MTWCHTLSPPHPLISTSNDLVWHTQGLTDLVEVVADDHVTAVHQPHLVQRLLDTLRTVLGGRVARLDNTDTSQNITYTQEKAKITIDTSQEVGHTQKGGL
jgi:hypothetical protein